MSVRSFFYNAKREYLNNSHNALGIQVLINLISAEFNKEGELREAATNGGSRILSKKFKNKTDTNQIFQLVTELSKNKNLDEFCSIAFSAPRNDDNLDTNTTYNMALAFSLYDKIINGLNSKLGKEVEKQKKTRKYVYCKNFADRFAKVFTSLHFETQTEVIVNYDQYGEMTFFTNNIDVKNHITNKVDSGYVDESNEKGSQEIWAFFLRNVILQVINDYKTKNRKSVLSNFKISLSIQGNQNTLFISGTTDINNKKTTFSVAEFDRGRYFNRSKVVFSKKKKTPLLIDKNELECLYKMYCIHQMIQEKGKDLITSGIEVARLISDDKEFLFCLAYARFIQKWGEEFVTCKGDWTKYTKMIDGFDPNLLKSLKPNEIVKNSLHAEKKIYVVSGTNAEGKTRFLSSLGINAVLCLNGLPCFAKEFSLSHRGDVFAHFTTNDDVSVGESLYMNEINRAKNIFENIMPRSLIFFDEPFKGTEPMTGSLQLLDTMIALSQANCLVFINTHFPEIQEWVQDNENNNKNLVNLCTSSVEKFKIVSGIAPKGYSKDFAQQQGIDTEWMNKMLKKKKLIA
jgi:hypothetical protein